jgi:hypothetical protein
MNHAIVLSTYLFPVRRQSAGSSHRIGSMHFASLRFAVRIDINRRVSRFRFERWSSSSRYLSLARFVGPVGPWSQNAVSDRYSYLKKVFCFLQT